ncbi:MAG: hypothetical protein V4732_13330 [Pseudomonadota bacterium]
MSSQKKLYIAGMGMVSPVGGNVAMTAATVNAGISAYAASDFYSVNGNAVTMALVPNEIFDEMHVEIGEGDRFSAQHDRIIKMAIMAANEASTYQSIKQPIPLLMAMTDVPRDLSDLVPFIQSLAENCRPIIDPKLTRSFYSGRAAGIEAIDFAFSYLFDAPQDFILIGGSDSCVEDASLAQLDSAGRLLANQVQNGYAPGEGAGFLLLTRHPELALVREGKIIALHPPGIAEESGHLHSKVVYRGDGLDQAFKRALINHQQQNIQYIYSSMNGENYWAKEMGVAQIRNKKSFSENVKIQHPADCIGDVGSATAPILIALAVERLFKHSKLQTHLVYSSSDTAKRGAIVIEKINALEQV